MKKAAEFFAAVGMATAVGFLFYAFGGLSYRAQGTVGEPDALNVTLSGAYLLLMYAASAWAGRHSRRGVLYGLAFVMAVMLGSGFVGFWGFGYILSALVYPYYVLSAPYAPLTELLLRLPPFYPVADMGMLVIPVCLSGLSVLFYLGGTPRRGERRGPAHREHAPAKAPADRNIRMKETEN